jgi:myosin-5
MSLERRNSHSGTNVVGIEQQVLQSNPILESFGNARTIRNDNSSRFGKFIEMRFDRGGTLVGASVETYLLEKVRLISQSDGERNYHVFYEMLAGMTHDDLRRFLLDEHDSAEDYRITSRSGTYDRRDGVRDADTYADLVEALDVMGFDADRQGDLFGIASAVLHLSNITINPIRGGEECEIDVSNVHLRPVLELLGVTRENLNQAMCYFKIEARGQSYTRAVQKDKAEKGLEALMKATYSAMFDYIVRTINSSITVKKAGGGVGIGHGGRAGLSRGESSSSSPGSAVIGVLDIFGFESFRTNSFEQLCINYCNEALQQQFNLFVLKNEQDIYEQEGINWSFISFPDNQDALDLIWKKGYGILNILDDQCRAPGTTDKTFASECVCVCVLFSIFMIYIRSFLMT